MTLQFEVFLLYTTQQLTLLPHGRGKVVGRLHLGF